MGAVEIARQQPACGARGPAARFVVCDFEMPIKLFMMPQTVPNSPTKGDVAPMVASNPMPSRIRRASARTISPKLDAARSLMPASLEIPADIRASRMAAASNENSTLPFEPSANCASASDRASAILPSAARRLRCTTDSSIIFAIKIVQVTSDAKARPIMTALTTTSADRNIDHGENSRSSTPAAFNSLPSRSGGGAAASEAGAAAAGAAATGDAGACDATGAAWTTGAAGPALGWACWAISGDASHSSASAGITASVTRESEVFILRPSNGSGCDKCRFG